MDQALIRQLAIELLAAEDSVTPIPPLTDRHPEITVSDAYQVQNAVVEMRLARGEVIIGKKIGRARLRSDDQRRPGPGRRVH